MEVIEDPSLVHNSIIDDVKVNNVQCNEPSDLNEKDHKSNGVNECLADQFTMEVVETDLLERAMGAITDSSIQNVIVYPTVEKTSTVDTSATEIIEENIDNSVSVSSDIQQVIEPVSLTEAALEAPAESEAPTEPGALAASNDNISEDQITFQTEIYVENNGEEIVEGVVIEEQVIHEDGHILTNINTIEQALQMSDANVENNNSPANEEVFNKEELLDILEGNNAGDSQQLETHIAMQQLSRLQKGKRYTGKNLQIRKLINSAKKDESDGTSEKELVEPKKRGRKKKVTKLSAGDAEKTVDKVVAIKPENKNTNEDDSSINPVKSSIGANTEAKPINTSIDKRVTSANAVKKAGSTNSVQNESIVKDLVQDWEDELEGDSIATVEDTHNIVQDADQLVQAQQTVSAQQESLPDKSIDSSSTDIDALIKSEDENQPQRRQSRVIKKKVIFDPDNPDTFTKGKVNKKDIETENEQSPSKKIKIETNILRSKSKSPTAKMQWKKPCPKNSKQNKRTTEIDRLLMDEGAVNMIYQLTPEAPKGGKNTRTKAEFIKKLQSSKPDSKEMKFRERKKEANKTDENEPKKLASGKRSSVSSSVKSAAFEDFENHSADDSIIYRRHSSSSYSSTCMSPRRLSDVEGGCVQSTPKIQQQNSSNLNHSQEGIETAENSTENIFTTDPNELPEEIINRDACLTIKQKLNSKLALALNKRKRESIKSEKPVKQKKMKKVSMEGVSGFEYLSIKFDQRMAEICIKKTGSKYDVETIKELERALLYVDTKKDISVTFLTSDCGSLCSNLDLTSILDSSMEKRTNAAYEIAESIRCLICSVNCHSKLLCTAVFGPCSGIALPLLVLSDIAMASDNATFKLAEEGDSPPVMLGMAVLSQPQGLPHSMLKDLVILGRQLSSAEAVQAGLVNRLLWPDKVIEQSRAIAKSIAAQPAQNILLKKQLLNLHKSGEAECTFLSALLTERDLVVEYWTSISGQEQLKAAVNTN